MKTRFRRLRDEEFDTAYAIVCERTQWLLERGLRQWPRPLAQSVYFREFSAGQIYTLAVEGRPAVVLSLMHYGSRRWRDHVGPEPHWWLCTLASSLEFRGRGLGARAVEEAATHLSGLGAERLHLDCIVHSDDFLPRYYQRLNFSELARKTVPRPGQESVEMALMRRALA
jgi:RimJ/RimL family protein N-acetyltransferase